MRIIKNMIIQLKKIFRNVVAICVQQHFFDVYFTKKSLNLSFQENAISKM